MDKNNNNNDIPTGKALSILGGIIGGLVLFTYGSTHHPQTTWIVTLSLFVVGGISILSHFSQNEEMYEKFARRLEKHQVEQEKKPYIGKLYWLYHRKHFFIPVFLVIYFIWLKINDAT